MSPTPHERHGQSGLISGSNFNPSSGAEQVCGSHSTIWSLVCKGIVLEKNGEIVQSIGAVKIIFKSLQVYSVKLRLAVECDNCGQGYAGRP